MFIMNYLDLYITNVIFKGRVVNYVIDVYAFFAQKKYFGLDYLEIVSIVLIDVVLCLFIKNNAVQNENFKYPFYLLI